MQKKTYNKGVVERGIDVSNAENQFTIAGDWGIGDVFLTRGLDFWSHDDGWMRWNRTRLQTFRDVVAKVGFSNAHLLCENLIVGKFTSHKGYTKNCYTEMERFVFFMNFREM